MQLPVMLAEPSFKGIPTSEFDMILQPLNIKDMRDIMLRNSKG